MTTVTLTHEDGSETSVQDPEFVDALCRVNEVVIDGDIYDEVAEVVFIDE